MNDFYPNPLPLKNLIKTFDSILKNPIKKVKSPPVSSTNPNKNYNELNVISDPIYSNKNEENSSTSSKVIAKKEIILKNLLKNFDVLVDSIEKVSVAHAERV